VLTLQNVTAGYGPTTVLRNVDFSVGDGEVVALLGPNGAGKTTLMKTAAGFVRPRSGQIEFDGTPMTGAQPHRYSRSGVCHLPEGRGIFPSLSVLDNLRIQCGRRPAKDAIDSVAEYFPELSSRMKQTAGSLSGGEQQMLALARAYVTSPKVVLVDEPSLGLAPLVIERIYEALGRLVERGISVVIVEQYVQRVLAMAKTVYILRRGEVVHHGASMDIDPGQIYERYLGTD